MLLQLPTMDKHVSPRAIPYEPNPLDDRDPLAPPPHLREAAQRLVCETYAVRHKSLAKLRSLIQNAPSTLCYKRTDDPFLLSFLRAKKFKAEAAFVELTNFFNAHAKHQWLHNIDPVLVEKWFSSESFQILPHCDPATGRLILSVNMKNLVPFLEEVGNNNSRHVLITFFGMLETIIGDIRAQIFGVVVVADLTKCEIRAFGLLSMADYILSLNLCQHCYPLRASGMYVIREPWYVRGMFNCMRPFMKSTVKKNLRCFGEDVTGVHSLIPKQFLPPSFGGSVRVNKDEHTTYWVDAVRRTIS